MNPNWGKDPLAPKLRKLADSGHPRAEELREKADAMDAAEAGCFADPPTKTAKSLLGAWARARKLWCECTGEPLV